MRRLTISTHFRGEAPEPAGQPPQTDPRASSVSVDAVGADGSPAGISRVSYETHATFTGETTFTESGTMRFDDGAGELDVSALADGTLGPSPEPEALHGAVVFRIPAGRGRFDGATGMITSNFLLWPARGEFDERQVAVVFVP